MYVPALTYISVEPKKEKMETERWEGAGAALLPFNIYSRDRGGSTVQKQTVNHTVSEQQNEILKCRNVGFETKVEERLPFEQQ